MSSGTSGMGDWSTLRAAASVRNLAASSLTSDGVTDLGRRQSTSSSSSSSLSLRNLAIQESQRNHASDDEKLTKFILLVLVLVLLMYYLRLEVEEVVDLMYSCKVRPET